MVPVEKPRHGTRAGKSGDTLQAENQMLRNLKDLILDSTREGIIGLDPIGKINLVNPAAAKMLSYEAEELLGRQYHTTCHPSKANDSPYPEEESPILAVLAKGNTCWQWDAVFWRKDGTSFPAEYSCYPILEHGKSQGGVLIFRDTTAHKRLEDDLLREKTFSEMIINLFPGIFFLIDERGRLLEWNENLEKVTGYSTAELAGMHTINFFAGDDKRLIAESTKRVFQGEEASEEVDLVGKDGSRTPYFFTGRRVTVDNANYKMGIGLDLTERKQLEKQLLHAQKMEAVGRLAGGVAHDFNNLLTAIMGYVEIMLGRLRPKDTLHRQVEGIRKAADRAAALTRQLLAFSRKQVLQPRILSLNAVIRQSEEMLQRLLGEDIELVTVLDDALGNVRADPGQMEQVIMNLAVNGRDAMPQGGKLILETANLEFSTPHDCNFEITPPGSYVMLAVSDSGVGMDPEMLPYLYEPFYTTKEAGKGTGLGLSIVHGIVKQSKGFIEVQSRTGVGTSFKIYLPLVEEAVAVEVAAPPNGLQGRETILVVEDEDMVLQLIADALRLRGYQILTAANTGEALLICERYQKPIHLLLTDVVMPKISGHELAERLAPLHPEMKVLYMSGYSKEIIGEQGVLEKGKTFIQKPFSLTQLGRLVRRALAAGK